MDFIFQLYMHLKYFEFFPSKEKHRLFDELSSISWLQPQQSDSNFLLVQVLATAPQNAEQLTATLRKQGILIRYFTNPLLANFIRISAGRPHDTDALMSALRAIGSFL